MVQRTLTRKKHWTNNGHGITVKKNISSTIKFLQNLWKENHHICASPHPTIDKIQFNTIKGERCFNFTTQFFNRANAYRHNKTELSDPFVLHGELGELKVHGSPAHTINTVMIPEGNSRELVKRGTIQNLELGIDSTQASYYRVLIPCENNKSLKLRDSLECTFYQTENSMMNPLVCLECNDQPFDLYEAKIDDKLFLCLDAMEEMTIKEFDECWAAITLSLCFVVGSVPRNELHILKSSTNTFLEIDGFHYKKVRDSIKGGMRLIDIQSIREGVETRDWYPMKGEHFSSLVSNIWKNETLFRAVTILCAANGSPIELRAPVYCVVLETVRNIIAEDYPDVFQPIKREFWKGIRDRIKDLVSKDGEEMYNDKSGFLKKIDYLNSPPNRESLLKAFKFYNVELLQTETDALTQRDKFLHGKIPFEKDMDEGGIVSNQGEQLIFSAYKLHMLACILILKYCGYSGYILNATRWIEFLSGNVYHENEPKVKLI